MGRQKYQTEEERKEAKKEYLKQYYQSNKERILEQQRQYRKENTEKIAEYRKQYRKDNAEYFKQYHQANREKIAEYDKEYKKTPMGRAKNLVNAYKQNDKKYNRGECTLTTKWIVDNIFNSKCIYCGESDWRKLGCDRIDNSLPHTPSNVVCCCGECNNKRQKKSFEEFINELR